MIENIFGTALRQLMPFLIFAVLAVVGLAALKARLGSGGGGSRAVSFPYVRRSGLFSEAEARFLRVLREAAPDADVFGKVRLEDVIVAKRGLSKSERASARGRIKSRHVDFVLTDPKSTRVLLVVELDDSSHASERAKKADAFKDGALAAAGVPILRVRASASYVVEDLARRVREAIDPVVVEGDDADPIVPFVPG